MTPRDSSITRPTSDSLRETIFNLVSHAKFDDYKQPDLQGCNFLDIFCGTGAVGLEAISRGASFCCFVDINREPLDLTKQNIEKFNISKQTKIIRANAKDLRPTDKAYDIVFLDPPYMKNLISPTISNLINKGWLAQNAMIIVEMAKGEYVNIKTGIKQLFIKDYGKSRVGVFKVL